jgi:hypothetical protein
LNDGIEGGPYASISSIFSEKHPAGQPILSARRWGMGSTGRLASNRAGFRPGRAIKPCHLVRRDDPERSADVRDSWLWIASAPIARVRPGPDDFENGTAFATRNEASGIKAREE